MLKVLVIAAFCIAVTLAASQCTSVCQSDVGQYCGTNGTVTYTCEYGLFCNGTSCADTLDDGDSCSPYQPQACPTGTTCTLVSYPMYTCQDQTSGPGQACDFDDDCQFNRKTGNTNCTDDDVCFGLGEGATCGLAEIGSGSVCNAGLWCNGSFCVAQSDLGGSCAGTYGAFACLSGLSCVNSVCVGFSQASGDDCTSTINCVEGLYCSGYSYTTPTVFGSCATPKAGSGKPCNITTYTTDCDADELCSCFTCVAPTTYPAGYGTAYLDWQDCIRNESVVCNGAVPSDCGDTCFTQWCNLYLLTGENFNTNDPNADCPYSEEQLDYISDCQETATTATATTATTGAATVATTGAATSGATTAANGQTVATSGTATTAGSTNGATVGTTGATATASSTGKTATTAASTTGSSTTSSASLLAAVSLFSSAVVFALLF